MPTCQQCHRKWNWKQTFKNMWTLSNRLSCPYCQEIQYQTQRSKSQGALLNMVVLLPLLLNIFFQLPPVLLLSLFPVIVSIVLLLNPFLIKLSNTEELITFKD